MMPMHEQTSVVTCVECKNAMPKIPRQEQPAQGTALGVCVTDLLCKKCGASSDVCGWLQLASARAEQERLEAEARRMRDAAHEQQLSVMRQTLTASKVRLRSRPSLFPPDTGGNLCGRPYLSAHINLDATSYPVQQAIVQGAAIELVRLPMQASARRSGEDGFGSVVGARSRQQSHSPLSPATGTSARPSQPQIDGLQDTGRQGGSRRGHSDSPSSPTLQPNTTPRIAQTPTLGTGKALHTLLLQGLITLN